jgi:hypothetical protein
MIDEKYTEYFQNLKDLVTDAFNSDTVSEDDN